ncbi:hypothetical protein ND748_07065 [Frankia sp. AiPs1]|uniref:DUF7144 family membrane protein n=1 Tax=Frankia sp. AiPs1 TaxID=573493 RepID=UPI0020431A27|nr:hypothetical protein [Frankia sp. AiPs1]MCM3921428.1 hypothetical protein [Frankia sp. AiPs1]
MAGNRAVRPLSGWLTFAAVIMFIVGFHNLIYGIAALRDYTVVVNNLNGGTNVLYADVNFWGWLWIAVGIVEMLIAYGIYIRNETARWAGIVIAAINAIGQLAFMAAFPVWSVVIIAIDILVIYALCTYDTARTRGGYEEPYPGDRAGVGAAAGRDAGVGGRHPETSGVQPGAGGFAERGPGGPGGRGRTGHGDEGPPPTVTG